MPKVLINFEGPQGSGKTTLSRIIRDHLGSLGFKVEYITKADSDILNVSTTKKLIGRTQTKLPNHK